MPDGIFMQVLDMTKAASIVILFVLAARLLCKKAPKIFSYALWAVVLFRLLCPFTPELPHSIVPNMEPIAKSYVANDGLSLPKNAGLTAQPMPGNSQEITPGVQNTHVETPDSPAASVASSASRWKTWILWGKYVWLAGMGALMLYSLFSFFSLRQRLIGSVLLRENIYLADHIDSPFVMGIIRPKIYLPSTLSPQELEYIILHEQHHIHRKDHLIKFLAFLSLCIHWFNPLVWLAFLLSSRDMELSCDEAVLKKLGEEIRYDYSASLLRLATGRRIIAGTPLAFGEGDTKCRIKNMLNWKKPNRWLVAAAVFICVIVIVGCAGNAASDSDQSTESSTGSTAPNPSTQPDAPSDKTDIPPSQSQNPAAPSPSAPLSDKRDELLQDVSFHLELAAVGKEFRSMDENRKNEILEEYGDLLNDYTLIARESTDGESVYIVGRYQGEPSQSTLHGMYIVEFNDQWGQVIYPEEDSAAIEEALAIWKEPTVGHRIKNSRIFWSTDGDLVLIQPKAAKFNLTVPWNRYLYTPNGREYIVDAISRGIDVCGATDSFVYVYRISEEFGELAERIALSEAEAAAILAEEQVQITDGFGFSASLHINGTTTYYTQRTGIPQTILDLAVERCDYRFGDPDMITDSIREAQLNCSWLDTPLYAKEEDLPRLREILKNAEEGYIGACGYGATLKLTFTGGEKLTIFKGTDSCDTIAFGSYSGYFIGDKENSEFWTIFGLDPDTKEPIS